MMDKAPTNGTTPARTPATAVPKRRPVEVRLGESMPHPLPMMRAKKKAAVFAGAL